MESFEQLLTKCPAELQDNIRYITTDKSGHRVAHFSKPTLNEEHQFWDATGPYHVIDNDPRGGANWKDSLMERPNNRWLWFMGAWIAALVALAGRYALWG